MKRMFDFLTVLALLPALSGQSGLSGPVQGIVFDAPTASLRQIQGSFGSASLGPALLSGLVFASFSPQQSTGVACVALQCSFVTASMEQSPIADQVEIPEGAAWSADGSVVVLFSRSGKWIRRFENGIGGEQWSIASLGGEFAAAAVSPDGKRTILALAGEHPGVLEATAAGAFVPVVAAQQPRALTYSKAGTLYVLDGQQVTEVHPNGLVNSWPVAVQDPSAIEAGSIIYIAGRADRALFTYDSAKHSLIEQIPLGMAPTQVQPSGTGSYLLNSRASEDDLLWSFTAGRGAFFIPVSPDGSASPQRKVRR